MALPPLQPRAAGGTPAPPLAGVRVIDFTRVVAGPFATQVLADLGAEVVKIEHPVGGDDSRTVPLGSSVGGESSFFLANNRGKRSVAIDLKSENGRAAALDLIATGDVLVENFSGAVMRRFGLDYPSLAERFPRLVYCSVSGYGRTGVNRDAAGYDSPVAAEAGALGLNRHADEEPVLGAIPYTDLSTALNAAIAILAALRARDRDGLGQFVDVAMFDSALANLSFQGVDALVLGREPRLNAPRSAGPRGRFRAADGFLVITVGGERMFRAFCTAVAERPDWLEDPRFATAGERTRNGDAFLAELDALFAVRTAGDWSARCKRAGIPCGAVRSVGDALTSPEAAERGAVFALPHPAGPVPAIAQPYRLSRTPCDYRAPPMLGADTTAVLGALPGYDEEKLAALVAAGAIGVAR